jgi:hypothetical protein
MRVWTHPSLGPIEFIPEDRSPKKVWQHFYDRDEHWERLCDADVAAMRCHAEKFLGMTRAEGETLPPLRGAQGRRARELLLAHHDESYAPAYSTEMAAPGTVWTPTMDARHRHRALTPRSVFIVVELDHPRSWIVTAFRPHPAVQDVDWTEDDLRRHGVSYFWRNTDVKVDELAPAVVESLRRVSTAASTAKELWWLASATGFGRLLRHVPEVNEALSAAEIALSDTPDAVIETLRRGLDWETLAGRLAEALKETRAEDLEAVLADAEELLAVASAVGAESDAEAFCNEAEMLLPWLPVEWAYLADRARQRLHALAVEESLIGRLWAAVEDGATGTLAREGAPSVHPVSRFAEDLIPKQSPLVRLRERIAVLATRTTATASAWITRCLERLSIEPLPPTMGGADVEVVEWSVLGRPSPETPHFRVFVVDANHPDGYEVTDKFSETDGDLWRLSEHERALVVIIAAEWPLVGETLAEVLEEATTRQDVVADARELQPTQTTKARR